MRRTFNRLQKLEVLGLLAILAYFGIRYGFVAVQNWRESQASDERYFRMRVAQDKLSLKLHQYQFIHDRYPASFDDLSFADTDLEMDIAKDVRKFYYYPKSNGYWIGYYDPAGWSITSASVKNTNEAQQSASANGR